MWRTQLLIYLAIVLATALFAWADFAKPIATPSDVAGSKVFWGSFWAATAFSVVAGGALIRCSRRFGWPSRATLPALAIVFAATPAIHLGLIQLGINFYNHRGLHPLSGETGMGAGIFLAIETASCMVAYIVVAVRLQKRLPN